MIISHKHKFIYIAIPRTGSTSIREALKQYSEEPLLYPYTPLQELSKKFNIADYFKFSFFRNPWDMLVSVYLYKKSFSNNFPDLNFMKYDSCIFKNFENNIINFNEWVRDNCSIMNNYFKKYKTMWDMVSDGDNLNVDYIGTFEHINSDFEYIKYILNLEGELKHLNKNNSKHIHPYLHYSDYYNDESKDLVLQTFTKEINYIGYGYEKINRFA